MSVFVCRVRLSSSVVRGWIAGRLKLLVMLEIIMIGFQLVSADEQSTWPVGKSASFLV